MLLQPTFSITIGRFQSTTADPVAGPQQIWVERDMDVPADALRLRLMNRSDITLGDNVNVELGHDGTTEIVFVGTVVALRPAIAGIAVQAMGKMQALLTLRLSATFENQSVGDIAHRLIQQAQLFPGRVESGPTLPRYAVDRRLSAFAHLKDLANRLGYELYSDRRGQVRFHDVAGGARSLIQASYAFGRDLLTADAISQAPTWSTIAVGGESPMSRRGDSTVHWLTTNEEAQRSGQGTPELLVLDPVARTQDLVRIFAEGRQTVANRTAHEVWLRVLGRPTVDLGDSVSPSALPDALMNGNGYVRALRHRLSDTAGFVTDIRVAIGGGV